VFGVNRLSTRHAALVLFLSFGPALIVGLGGALAGMSRTAVRRLIPIWITLVVSAIFYFLVDVPEHQSVYIAWRASHLAFVAFTVLCAFAIQEWWARRGAARWIFSGVALVVALAALPMVLIDLYNTQDVSNRAMGPGFRWTVILNPGELQGLEWIRRNLPVNARVQAEPTVRGRDTWTYIPGFAERRMAGGLPIGMIPLAKYERASSEIAQLYSAGTAADVYQRALSSCIDYLVVGPAERRAYPKLPPLLEGTPQLFAPVFRNEEMAVYAVSGSWNQEGCAH
jgi:hypothetical protein